MKNKNLITRALNELKFGWSLAKLPEEIQRIDINIYVRLFKFIGAGCLFLIISGIARDFNKITFYIVFLFSFLYSLYRLFLVLYALKQFIIIVYSGRVRNSPFNMFNTIFRTIATASRTTVNFTVGTGISYALCYELDEILVIEGKKPYFVPGIRQIVKIVGGEELAKTFLNKVGIKDSFYSLNSKSITELLESMTEEERANYESETGQSWDALWN